MAGFVLVNPSGVGRYRGLIGAEVVYFTSGAVTAGTQTWTVTRAQEGTTGAIHLSGTVLKLEATAGAVANAVQLTPTAQQTGSINVSGAITSGGLLTGTGLAAPHAATHYPNSTDDLSALLQLLPGPSLHNYITWTVDPILLDATLAPTAGTLYMARIKTPYAYTINSIDLLLNVAGTGVTSLANCFVGIYDAGGTRRFASSDQASVWNSGSNVVKTVTVSGGYVVTANSFIYLALLVGTQSTTPVKFFTKTLLSVTEATLNLTTGTYRFGSQATSQSSLPSPSVVYNLTAQNSAFFFGVY